MSKSVRAHARRMSKCSVCIACDGSNLAHPSRGRRAPPCVRGCDAVCVWPAAGAARHITHHTASRANVAGVINVRMFVRDARGRYDDGFDCQLMHIDGLSGWWWSGVVAAGQPLCVFGPEYGLCVWTSNIYRQFSLSPLPGIDFVALGQRSPKLLRS